MRRLILLFVIMMFVGCAEGEPHEFKFAKGQIVTFKTVDDGRQAVVVQQWQWGSGDSYDIEFVDEYGHVQSQTVSEHILEAVPE